MAQRRGTKRNPRLDDEERRAVESIVRGHPVEARADADRVREGSGDHEPTPEELVRGDRFPTRVGRPRAQVRARSELARRLAEARYPATVDELRQVLVEAQVRADLIAVVDDLPARQRFETFEQVWEALGGSRETRG